ncbi:MAG: hypothetical protein LBC39_07410 [Methanobrevibacter sp.]|jgi:hypothetical protein|nr:hypothetical protein [Candidatus Methanovirga aequatorialis]
MKRENIRTIENRFTILSNLEEEIISYLNDNAVIDPQYNAIFEKSRNENFSIYYNSAFKNMQDAIYKVKLIYNTRGKIIDLLKDIETMEREFSLLIILQKLINNIEDVENVNRKLLDILIKIIMVYVNFLEQKHTLEVENNELSISENVFPLYEQFFSRFYSDFIDLEADFYNLLNLNDDNFKKSIKVAYNELR